MKNYLRVNLRGFSLIELIIAVSMVGVMVFVISNIPNTISLVTSSKYDSTVREVAAKKIEDIRSAGFDSLVNGTTAIDDSRLNSLANAAAFTVVDDCPPEICVNNEEIRRVTLTISWSEKGEPKTYQIVTLIGKDGLR